MDLLHVLKLPLQAQSLLLAGINSLVITLVISVGGIRFPLAWFALYIMVVWSQRYAFALLEATANGESQAPVASVELLSPYSDARSWVAPLLVSLLVLTLFVFQTDWPRLPWLVGALLLLPLSLVSTVISDRLLDALNPLAWGRNLLGLREFYGLAVAASALAMGCAALLWRSPLPLFLCSVTSIMLLFVLYAVLGGLVHTRRKALNFSPRFSPERDAEKRAAAQAMDRQRALDDLFVAVRARQPQVAVLQFANWLDAQPVAEQVSSIHALLQTAQGWTEQRSLAATLCGLLEQRHAKQQPAQALQLAEQLLNFAPNHLPADPKLRQALSQYALQTGRKRLAAALAEDAS